MLVGAAGATLQAVDLGVDDSDLELEFVRLVRLILAEAGRLAAPVRDFVAETLEFLLQGPPDQVDDARAGLDRLQAALRQCVQAEILAQTFE